MALRKKPNSFDCSVYTKPGLSLEQVQQAKQYFDQMSDKQTGQISGLWLREILESYGQKARQNQLHYTLQVALDKFGEQSVSGAINFQQFLYLVTSVVTDQDSKIQMRRLFNLYDDDRNGYLTKEKLRKIADQYGIWVEDEELELMVKSANQMNDGKVTEEDFYMIMTSQTVRK